jgi:hypothetical protein
LRPLSTKASIFGKYLFRVDKIKICDYTGIITYLNPTKAVELTDKLSNSWGEMNTAMQGSRTDAVSLARTHQHDWQLGRA